MAYYICLDLSEGNYYYYLTAEYSSFTNKPNLIETAFSSSTVNGTSKRLQQIWIYKAIARWSSSVTRIRTQRMFRSVGSSTTRQAISTDPLHLPVTVLGRTFWRLHIRVFIFSTYSYVSHTSFIYLYLLYFYWNKVYQFWEEFVEDVFWYCKNCSQILTIILSHCTITMALHVKTFM